MNLIIVLLVGLILFGLAFWVTRTLAAAFKIPEPITAVIYVVLVIVAILWLLQQIQRLPGLNLNLG